MSQPLTVPIVFSQLPPGPVPMSLFDENFAWIIQNMGAIFAASLVNLPTTLPSTPNTLWNNGGVICITGP